mmetsp:Transcript_6007/g.9352  ORF Transcript_6007/g.9352 Transcript_6007/m.9352 type:complete len:187 (-) Transcript_6007:384-944(-)
MRNPFLLWCGTEISAGACARSRTNTNIHLNAGFSRIPSNIAVGKIKYFDFQLQSMAYSSNDISSCSMIVFCRDSVSKGILNAHVFQILMGVPGLLSWAFGNGRRSGEVDETWERRYLDMRRRKQGDVKEEEQEKIIVVDGYSTINYVFCNHLELITFDLRAFAERIRELVAGLRRRVIMWQEPVLS